MKCLFCKTLKEFLEYAQGLVGNWYVMEETIQNRYDQTAHSKQREELFSLAKRMI